MPNIKAAITAVEGYVPDNILTNKDLEKLVETNDEWIVSRTGIKERRILKDPNLATSDLAVPAVKKLLEKRGISASELDLIICATVTGDTVFPDTANTIATKIGATKAWGFDLLAACSSFLYALTTGAQYIAAGSHKKVLVIGADKMSSIVDYTDRNTCILFGDGAGVVLLEPSENEFGFERFSHYGDGSGGEFLHMLGGGSKYPASHETVDKRMHYIYQEGRAVFKRAVMGMSQAVKQVLEDASLDASEVNWVVPHQANLRIINAVADGAGIDMDRVMVNIDKYGNTTSATIPLCLWEYENQLKKGDKLVLTAFGGGFTWGAIYLTWAK